MGENEIEYSKSKGENSYKLLFAKCGFFCLIVSCFFLVLVISIFLSRDFWKDGLKAEIQETLMVNDFSDIEVGEWIKLKSTINITLSAYEAKKNGSEETFYVVISRIPTLYGAVPAVFISTKQSANFIGLADLKGSIESKIISNSVNSQIFYWKNKIPNILQTLL